MAADTAAGGRDGRRPIMSRQFLVRRRRERERRDTGVGQSITVQIICEGKVKADLNLSSKIKTKLNHETCNETD